MKSTPESIQSLQRFRGMFQDLSNFMDDKDTHASLEQAIQESVQRLEAKRKEEEEIDGRLADIEAKERQADELLQRARKKADAIHDEIQVDRDAILASARELAETINKRAQEDSERLAAPFIAERDLIKQELASYQAQRDHIIHQNQLLADEALRLEERVKLARDAITKLLGK